MSSIDDGLWSGLQRLGIFPCDNDNHQLEIFTGTRLSSMRLSLHFECLIIDSLEISDVNVVVNRDGSIDLEIYEIAFSNPIGMNANAEIRRIRQELTDRFQQFFGQ